MASIQRLMISFMLVLSFAFVFFAQGTEANKGPKITHKTCVQDLLRYEERRQGHGPYCHWSIWQDCTEDC
ncbi:predicted protein [Plenodomus lingam JN3]|uniref:Predicted protein n=1 Tax=Leptosphaeria maculans (strain JN3 / isolate v23.1.3 / race Av1-4-5-6-7-8) TaxID=985895 RepID=E5A4H1_LEPMJ|nr:predicted protein [Plenodomus lingam JN3]CBX98519.1 predicted protein [Plenodomus lingam JN3]